MSLERPRLDAWLWHARVVRTRSAASALVKAGRVRVNGARVTTPAHAAKLGDVVTIALDSRVRILRISGFSERRGDAQTASALYIEVTEPG
jgi:ribosome-associated heat shock protein Hsp15